MYRARCMWCNGWTRPQRSKKRAVAGVKNHLTKSSHPRRDRIIEEEAIKRSIVEVG